MTQTKERKKDRVDAVDGVEVPGAERVEGRHIEAGRMDVPPVEKIPDGSFFRDMPIPFIAPWSENPRKAFDGPGLEELRDSIAVDGVQQAIEVRVTDPNHWIIEPDRRAPRVYVFDKRWFKNFGKPDATYHGPSLVYGSREEAEFMRPRFEVVMGERRLRAATMAGLETIPCIVRVGMDDRTALRRATQENLRRANLNAIEEAGAYQALIAAGEKAADLAALLGVSAPVISNRLRLLKLPASVQSDIAEGRLGVSHGLIIAKFAEFPAVAGAIAQIVMEQGVPSHKIEKEIPREIWWPLEQSGIVKSVQIRDYRDQPTKWAAHCLACPFNAFHKDVREGNPGYDASGRCLRPEHYAELGERFLQEASEAAKADMARLEAAAAASPRVQAKLEKATRGGSAEQSGVLILDKLEYGSYEEIRTGDPCPGCTKECPCRAVALRSTNQPVEICIDRARRNALKAAATRDVKKGLRLAQAERLARFEEMEKGVLTDIGRRALAVLACSQLTSAPVELKRKVANGLPAGPLREWMEKTSFQHNRREGWDVLVASPFTTIVFTAIELMIRKEFEAQLDDAPHPRPSPLADFILQDAPAPAAVTAEGGAAAANGTDGTDRTDVDAAAAEASRACPLCGADMAKEWDSDREPPREEWYCEECWIAIPVVDPKGCPTCGEDMYASFEAGADRETLICPGCRYTESALSNLVGEPIHG